MVHNLCSMSAVGNKCCCLRRPDTGGAEIGMIEHEEPVSQCEFANGFARSVRSNSNRDTGIGESPRMRGM